MAILLVAAVRMDAMKTMPNGAVRVCQKLVLISGLILSNQKKSPNLSALPSEHYHAVFPKCTGV